MWTAIILICAFFGAVLFVEHLLRDYFYERLAHRHSPDYVRKWRVLRRAGFILMWIWALAVIILKLDGDIALFSLWAIGGLILVGSVWIYEEPSKRP